MGPIQVAHLILQALSLPALLMVLIATAIYIFGPVACIMLSAWRIGQRDYGDTLIDDSKRNLVPALDIFYTLVICQGVLFFSWWLIDHAAVWIVVSLRKEWNLPKEWGITSLVEYLFDTRLKCWRDPASIDGVNLINYAVDLLDSGLQKDYLSGARLIDTFIKLEADVKSLLLPSRPKIQKLIDTLGWRSSDTEIRELAARIIAYLASDIHLTQFPGSVRCISSLLDTTALPYWSNKQRQHQSKMQQVPHDHSPQSKSEKGSKQPKLECCLRSLSVGIDLEEALRHMLLKGEKPPVFNNKTEELVYLAKEEEQRNEERAKKQDEKKQRNKERAKKQDEKRQRNKERAKKQEDEEEEQRNEERAKKQEDVQHKEVDRELTKGDDLNRLILEGLTILERLASDQYNCRDICSSTNGLLPKIMAPLYSRTLIQDINIRAWADVVNGSFKVVHRLIHAPGRTGTRLRHEICSSNQAEVNLKGILDQRGKINKELLMHAIEILTELASDSPTKLSRETKDSLIHTQMEIFLAVDEEKEKADTKYVKLKVTAGKTLALLSKTQTTCVFIMGKEQNIVAHLSGILKTNNNIKYKTIAAEILENLCTTLDKKLVKDSLLPTVHAEVLTYKREAPTETSQQKEDALSLLRVLIHKVLFCKREKRTEVSQRESAAGDDEEKQLPKQKDQIKSSDQANEEQMVLVEWQEALLSLTLVIRNKLITPEVAPEISLGDGELVAALNTIVQDNLRITTSCLRLRIVKLCGQIALLMIPGSQYTMLTQYTELVKSLSTASELMSNLESGMLFAGTDYGMKNSVRPLLFDLENDLKKAIKSFEHSHGS
ncbi:hypothetical protein BRADI_4g23330v3 [Brachypodium distachyon]|uniref:Uncharacterized protein n=1 Tax=Brachypodium distachyon TaxID=15368 RepID=A0A2K2CPQ6_BRADI|nr:hypothetical protein BRADI_4g23330v3 [Brachypodium distachyon]